MFWRWSTISLISRFTSSGESRQANNHRRSWRTGRIRRNGTRRSDDVGFFYLIQLEPEHDPRRFKLGFTMDLDGRLQKHRCSAPYAQYIDTWPCKRVWERAAIDCVTNGCEQLHTEVFRTASLEQISAQAKSFVSMMPNLEEDSGDAPELETVEKAG